MNDHEFVVSMLQPCSKAAVAKAVGLSARTVREVASGVQKNPTYETIRKLAEYFRERAGK